MKNAKAIYDELNLSAYTSYDAIPAAKKAWITIKAKKQGIEPELIHSEIIKIMGGNYQIISSKKQPVKNEEIESTSHSNMYVASKKQWNPFKGCNFDCVYCESSFKRQAKRQKHNCNDCYTYTPHTHPERLNSSLPKTGPDEFIFTCASGDVAFCPTDFLKQIINRIKASPNKTFLIQSKNPKTFQRVTFPENVILGITLETNRDQYKISKAPLPSQRYQDFLKINHPQKMITIEPVIDFDLDILAKWVKDLKPVVVWLGYDSGKNQLPEPTLDKFYALQRELENDGIKVKLKTVREGRVLRG